jgi:hypothetical protein
MMGIRKGLKLPLIRNMVAPLPRMGSTLKGEKSKKLVGLKIALKKIRVV